MPDLKFSYRDVFPQGLAEGKGRERTGDVGLYRRVAGAELASMWIPVKSIHLAIPSSVASSDVHYECIMHDDGYCHLHATHKRPFLRA